MRRPPPGCRSASSGSDRKRREFRDLLPQGGTLPEASWVRRHRGVVVLLWLHSVVIPIYALIMGYSLGHSVLEGLIVPTAATVASMGGLARRVRTMAAAVGLLSSSAVLVHLSGGLIEMHFHFFVAKWTQTVFA